MVQKFWNKNNTCVESTDKASNQTLADVIWYTGMGDFVFLDYKKSIPQTFLTKTNFPATLTPFNIQQSTYRTFLTNECVFFFVSKN